MSFKIVNEVSLLLFLSLCLIHSLSRSQEQKVVVELCKICDFHVLVGNLFFVCLGVSGYRAPENPPQFFCTMILLLFAVAIFILPPPLQEQAAAYLFKKNIFLGNDVIFVFCVNC